LKTNFSPDEFYSTLHSVGEIVKTLSRSKNYQELLTNPEYTPTNFTLTDAVQAIEEVKDTFLELTPSDSLNDF
jgi:hypothetical protein